mmetsp:Transcript_12654/g.16519  ORF Transcript_12654/g.16519 Transcript_12654/m.16519 type:complete len:88 (+) Transcript_12654:80-343(+)
MLNSSSSSATHLEKDSSNRCMIEKYKMRSHGRTKSSHILNDSPWVQFADNLPRTIKSSFDEIQTCFFIANFSVRRYYTCDMKSMFVC